MRLALAFLVLSSPPAFGEVSGAADKARWDKRFDGAASRPSLPPVLVPDLAGTRAKKPAGQHPVISGLFAAQRENAISPAWPGYAPLDQPIAIYGLPDGDYLVGHPAPPAGYARAGLGGSRVYRAEKGPAPFQGPFLFHYDLNGVDTFAINVPDPKRRAEMTIVHERFHIFQETAFADGDSYPGRYPKADGTDVALANLENAALAAALDSLRTPDARRYARMFVAVRNFRRRQNPEDCAKVEDGQERLEGMARYVELKLAGEPGRTARGTGELSNQLRDEVTLGRMSKWRYYATGAAQGYLLDAAGRTGWKAAVTSGAGVFSEAAKAYPAGPAEEAVLLAAAQAEFDYPALLARANASVSGELRAVAEALEAFEKKPLPRVILADPKGADGGFSFKKNFVLADGSWLMPSVTLFENFAPGYRLSISGLDIINGKDGTVQFHIPAAAAVRIDDAPAEVPDGTTRFSSLHIVGGGLELKADIPGTITKDGAGLKIEFDEPAKS